MRLDGRAVLVTGGAGFIGSHVVDALVERSCRVRVLDDLSVGRRENIATAMASGDVELQVGDIRDADACAEAVEGMDVVLHMAVSCLRVSLYDPWANHTINAGGTLSMLEAAAAQGVERFVYSSSSEVYGSARTVPMAEDHPTDPTTVYGASKLAGEGYALAFNDTHDLPVTVVCPFNAYGPREHHEGASGEVIPRMTVRALAGQAPIIFGDGLQTRDFTYVTESVTGLLAATESDELVGRRINIGFGREVSIARIAELVCEAAGADLEPEYRPARPADVYRHYADVTRARELLGFQATIPIEEGIGRYVAWAREEFGDAGEAESEAPERNWEAPSPR